MSPPVPIPLLRSARALSPRESAGWRGTSTTSLPRLAQGMGGAGAAHGKGQGAGWGSTFWNIPPHARAGAGMGAGA